MHRYIHMFLKDQPFLTSGVSGRHDRHGHGRKHARPSGVRAGKGARRSACGALPRYLRAGAIRCFVEDKCRALPVTPLDL